MMPASREQTSLVPQSTSLKTIRLLLQALAKGGNAVAKLGFSARRFYYARNACRALGLLDGEDNLTEIGAQLLAEMPGTRAEGLVLRRVLEQSEIIRKIAPDPFVRRQTREEIAKTLKKLYGFSETTARDRAATLSSWLSQIEALTSNGAQERELPHEGSKPSESATRPKKRASKAGEPPTQLREGSDADSSTAEANSDSRASRLDRIPKSIPKLVLPKRYERLRAESEKVDLDPLTVVQRVDSAARRVDYLLRKVRDGRTGQFEVFFGASGSGKTTFLSSLPKFFDGVAVFSVRRSDGDLESLAARVEKDYTFHRKKMRVYFFDDRDNEKLDPEQAERFFESLRVLFRKDEGQVLVIWPVTRPGTRDQLAAVAWSIGADSIVSIDTKGVYNFRGVPQEQYFEVADLTAKSLNGESLEGYGVSRDDGEKLARESETIGEYFHRLEAHASERRDKTWSVLQEKIRPRLWVVLPGDIGHLLDGTVSRLTQGRKYKIDVERLLEFLDDPTNESIYLQDWRRRRPDAAYLLRILDVRLVPLHAGAALAAIRGFGSESVRKHLVKNSISRREAIDSIQRSVLYKMILEELGGSPEPYTKGRPPSAETETEYNRVQSLAKSGDKPLNHALAEALKCALSEEGYNPPMRSERRGLGDTGLQPDIQLETSDAEVICLEPTWRTSGKSSKGQGKASQNSMRPGSIQKYVLEKVMEYVKALTL